MAPNHLEGQVAFVTGGASGIGRATVLALAEYGARVAVVDQDADGAAAVVDEVTATGGEAMAVVVDLADASAVDPAVASVLERFGRIDILVNGAGLSGAPHSAIDFDLEKYELITAVNLRAPFLLVRAIGRHMVDRGEGGRIVNVSSSAAFRASLAPAIYAATKAGINGLTRAAAADLGPHGVNVNAVAPGVTATPMMAGLGGIEVLDELCKDGPLANLLHRASEPEDVANVIRFLCLPESRQVTGQVVHTSAGLIV